VKHLPAGTAIEDLRELFDKHGTIGRLLLPPRGLTALIEYVDATEARATFRSLAYTKVSLDQAHNQNQQCMFESPVKQNLSSPILAMMFLLQSK